MKDALKKTMYLLWVLLPCMAYQTSFPQTKYLNELESQSATKTKIRLRQMYQQKKQRFDDDNFITRKKYVIKKEEYNNTENIPIVFPSPVIPILRFNKTNFSIASFLGGSRMSYDSDDSSDSSQFFLEKPDTSFNFSNVGGYTELKKELHQVMDFVQNPIKYTQYGLRMPRGILLEGPTGNGKTLIAKCLAGEANMSFVACSGSEFVEKYVGVGASRIRELFRFVTKHQPCILFIDEIDALGQSRSKENELSNAERDQTLNQLLVMMDGFHGKDDKIMIIGATNRIDMLDKALLRPGRFDKIIHVPNPDVHTRKEILQIHWSKKPINATIDYVVRLTSGFNGAQIENLLNEATLTAIRNDSLPVSEIHLEIAREKQILGQISTVYRNITEKTLRRIAIHEMGHLLMALKSDTYEKPWKVTIDSINPRNSLGYTIFENEEIDQGFFLREYLEQKIGVLLGGRVAEEVFYGQSVSSGALSDLEHAFALAKKMIMEYGMGRDIIYPYFSETYKKKIDQEINSILLMKYRDTKKIIMDNQEWIEFFVSHLLTRKTLVWDDIQELNRQFQSKQYLA